MSDDDLIRRGDVLRLIIGTAHLHRGPSTDLQRMIRAIPATDAREKALREAADLFQLHPWSWSAKEIRAKILALIGEART